MTSPDAPFRRIAVLGTGLIGGSFALASAALPGVERVTVYDAAPEVRAGARERGVGTHVAETLADAVSEAQLVLLAVPVAEMAEVARDAVRHARPGALLTDVGSVKSDLVEEMEGFIEKYGRKVRFLGGHPMAGSEQGGIGAADPTLFQAATWLLTPGDEVDAEGLGRLSAHLRALGARVLAVDAQTHDRLVAVASHLPQVVASVLADEAEAAARTTGEPILTVAGGGFRDVTRLAASDPDLWTGILDQNRSAVVAAIRAFTARLTELQEALEEGDVASVRDRLAAGRAARERLPDKKRAGVLVDVVIPLDDRPGQLAAVTTALGAAGVNIEDLLMRHATEGERGALVIAVDGRAAADSAQEVLAERGYHSHVEPRSSGLR